MADESIYLDKSFDTICAAIDVYLRDRGPSIDEWKKETSIGLCIYEFRSNYLGTLGELRIRKSESLTNWASVAPLFPDAKDALISEILRIPVDIFGNRLVDEQVLLDWKTIETRYDADEVALDYALTYHPRLFDGSPQFDPRSMGIYVGTDMGPSEKLTSWLKTLGLSDSKLGRMTMWAQRGLKQNQDHLHSERLSEHANMIELIRNHLKREGTWKPAVEQPAEAKLKETPIGAGDQPLEARPKSGKKLPKWFPTTDNTRKRWARAYAIIIKMRKAYAKRYDASETDIPLPRKEDISAALLDKMHWSPGSKTVGYIIKAGDDGLFKDSS